MSWLCLFDEVEVKFIVQKFDFSFEEEDSIDGMKKLIVAEVNAFRAEVRAQARAAGQIRRQDRSVFYLNRWILGFLKHIPLIVFRSLLGMKYLAPLSRNMVLTMGRPRVSPRITGTSDFPAQSWMTLVKSLNVNSPIPTSAGGECALSAMESVLIVRVWSKDVGWKYAFLDSNYPFFEL